VTPGDLCAWLAEVVRPLLSAPEELKVTGAEGGIGTLLELRVAELDLGRVIGRDGATIDSLRQLVRAVSGRHHLHAVVDVAATRAGSSRGGLNDETGHQ
jgi:predicted RNA-binding protein YlqC (UPF0109 family)